MICSICLNNLTLGFEVTECGHKYHKQCIDTWLETAYTCPDCRHQLKFTTDCIGENIVIGSLNITSPFGTGEIIFMDYVEI